MIKLIRAGVPLSTDPRLPASSSIHFQLHTAFPFQKQRRDFHGCQRSSVHVLRMLWMRRADLKHEACRRTRLASSSAAALSACSPRMLFRLPGDADVTALSLTVHNVFCWIATKTPAHIPQPAGVGDREARRLLCVPDNTSLHESERARRGKYSPSAIMSSR